MADWDGLRGELESAFEPPPFAALRERRRRRQQRRTLAVTSGLVLVTIASGVAVLGGARDRRDAPPRDVAIGRPIDRVVNGDTLPPPEDYEDHVVTDVDFVSPTTGWAIGLRCAGDACDVATWRTDDGGRTWGAPTDVARAVPRVTFHEQDPSGGAVRSLRMVNETEGFAFGPDLYVTHDGARTWRRVPQPSKVASVQVQDGVAWVFERGCAIAVDCDAVLRTGRVGRSFALSDAAIPPTGGAPGVLRRAGPRNGYLLTWDAPGEARAALRTTADAGRTWRDATHPCPDATAVSLSAGLGRPLWAVCTVGGAKHVHLSADSGRTWRRAADAPRPGTVTDLIALSATKAYLTTQVPARLWVTSDGGASWQPAAGTAQAGYGYGNLDVADATHAWAMGDAGILWRTTDGVRWDRLALPPGAPRSTATPPSRPPSAPARGVDWTGLSFRDARHGWALGRRCAAEMCRLVLRRTDDGGATWRDATAPGGAFPDEPLVRGDVTSVTFAPDGRTGYLYDPRLYVTHDGGATWRDLERSHVRDVVVRDGAVWLLQYGGCAGSDCAPYAARARLGSDDFTSAFTDEDSPFAGQVTLAVADADTAYLVEAHDGDARHLVATRDGGRTWSAERPAPCPDAYRRAAATPGDLWVLCTDIASRRFRSAHSADGGRTFAVVDGDPARPLARFVALSPAVAWRTTDGRTASVHVTRDGGRTWAQVDPPGYAASRGAGSFHVVDARIAFAMVVNGGTELWRTADAGRTWRRVAAP